LNLIAQQLWFEGRLSESRNASERALAVAERTLRPEHPTIALSLRYLAGTQADLGDLRRSASLKERALAISERNFGLNHHVTGEYVHALGLAELDLGDYQTARRHFQRALGIFEARYGPWHEYVATTLSVLAVADASLGDYASARREQSRAVAVHARVGGPNHPFVATALTELATVYRDQGLSIRALPLLERALAIREKSLKPDHRDVARTLADLSATLVQVNRPVQAQSQATRALPIWERLDAPDAPEYATVLALYAELQANRGDYAAARSHFEKALQIRAKALGVSHPSYAEAESGLGVALAALGQMEPALHTAIEAEATGREHLRLMLRTLPEREALNYAATRPRALNLIVSMSASTPEAAPAAFEGVIRSRALVLDEIATRQSAGTSVQADPLRLGLASAQQRLANLLVRGPGQLSWAQYQAVVEATRRESELAEQAFAERSAEFRAERSRALIGLEQVRASLSTQHALVSFARYDRLAFGATKRDASAPNSRAPRSIPSYVALVLRPPGDPVAVPLGSATSVDTLVAEWRQGILAEVAGGPSAPVRPSRVSGAALRRLVWDPIANQLQGADRVFIVPDGSLGLVPFAALPVGARSYLLDVGPALHYLSAERDVVPSSRSPAATGGLLAVGGPAFDNRIAGRMKANPARPAAVPALVRGNAVCGSLQTIRFDPLVGALQEVNELSRVWNDHLEGAADVGAARLLTGSAADETAFKREAPRHRVLHLATHGFFLGGGCSPAIGTRGVGGLSTVRPARTPIDNPLLLSGLAFSGANRRASAAPDQDDGILTAEEVASLNLQGTEWAVLSACDTGLGAITAGEGVFGLRRAFQIAGVRTVIMSLWSVDDQATRLWMRALYDGRLNRHLNTADAVREASLTVLRARRARGQSTHPFFWAAFVAAGDWR
jgi:CHAT domain-containing protein/tetratricopeptide (TPR) repeat protein